MYQMSPRGRYKKTKAPHSSPETSPGTSPETSSDAKGDPSSGERPPVRRQRSARARLMDLLARRNYSPTEIRQKLGDEYPSEEIEMAIEFARESRWLLPEEEMATQVANSLSRKKKGHRYIQQYLKSKGLPPVAKNPESEFENGLALVRSKFARTLASGATFDYEYQKKAQRLLLNRGYDETTIREVIKAFVREASTD